MPGSQLQSRNAQGIIGIQEGILLEFFPPSLFSPLSLPSLQKFKYNINTQIAVLTKDMNETLNFKK